MKDKIKVLALICIKGITSFLKFRLPHATNKLGKCVEDVVICIAWAQCAFLSVLHMPGDKSAEPKNLWNFSRNKRLKVTLPELFIFFSII